MQSSLTNAQQSPDYFKGPKGVGTPQLQCIYAEAAALLPGTATPQGTFVPTHNTLADETVAPGCEGYPTPDCADAWITVNGTQYYVTDVPWFTLTTSHDFKSSVGIHGSSTSLDGQVLDSKGARLDPCLTFDQHKLPCPISRSQGLGQPDQLPVIARFNAAVGGGLIYLDENAGGTHGGLLGIHLSINYSNSYLPSATSVGTGQYNDAYVQYTYTVSIGEGCRHAIAVCLLNVRLPATCLAAPDVGFTATDYKFSGDYTPSAWQVTPASGNNGSSLFCAAHHQVHTACGMRVIATQTGTVGALSAYVLFVNFAVALGLMGICAPASV